MDQSGVEFWKNNFINCSFVKWNLFITKLLNYLDLKLSIDSLEVTCFKFIVCVDDENVTRKDFGNCLCWFGPLQKNEPENVFKKIYETFTFPYFHGHLGGLDARSLLTSKCNVKYGSYLVRLSNRKPYSYCISIQKDVTGTYSL